MYYVIGIYAIFMLFTIFFRGNKKEKLIMIIPISFLALFSGTRKDIGGYDYYVYEYFYNLANGENPYGYEKFFVYLRDFMKMLNFSYWEFLFSLSCIFSLIMYHLLKKYSVSPIFSFLIYISTYYYWHNFTIIRNYIAILIFWISLEYIIEKKPIKYFLLITIAFMFHKTSIILYPMYYLLNLKLNTKKIMMFYGVGLLLNPLSSLAFKIQIDFLGLSERLTRYSQIVEKGNFFEFSEMGIYTLALILLAKDLNEEENIFFNISVFSFLIFLIFYRFAIILRFLEFFRIGIIVLLPYVFNKIEEKIENKNLKYCFLAVFLTYFSWRYYYIVTGYLIYNYKTWIPYL
ncbi:MAG: EpsG family protein [Fusobacteriaceae bacterium]